mmetsp:Transcript_30178/g.48673  ORF Transcript_30178/g.48673 Transcript_30178/m.48673 type:complete len:276 (-) Transcript_30178:1797-2624(-)
MRSYLTILGHPCGHGRCRIAPVHINSLVCVCVTCSGSSRSTRHTKRNRLGRARVQRRRGVGGVGQRGREHVEKCGLAYKVGHKMSFHQRLDDCLVQSSRGAESTPLRALAAVFMLFLGVLTKGHTRGKACGELFPQHGSIARLCQLHALVAQYALHRRLCYRRLCHVTRAFRRHPHSRGGLMAVALIARARKDRQPFGRSAKVSVPFRQYKGSLALLNLQLNHPPLTFPCHSALALTLAKFRVWVVLSVHQELGGYLCRDTEAPEIQLPNRRAVL